MAENRMSGVGLCTLGIAVVLMSAGCGGATSEGAPPRSPSQDYPPPSAQTSDGEVIGADRTRLEEKLETSPRVGLGGIVPAARPPHGEPKSSP